MAFFKKNKKHGFEDIIETNPEKEALKEKLKEDNRHTIKGRFKVKDSFYALCDDSQILSSIELFKKCFNNEFKSKLEEKDFIVHLEDRFVTRPDGSVSFEVVMTETYHNPAFLKNHEENDLETDRKKYIEGFNEIFFDDFSNFMKAFSDISEDTLFVSKFEFWCDHCKESFIYNYKNPNKLVKKY